jgi:hypothetical protein
MVLLCLLAIGSKDVWNQVSLGLEYPYSPNSSEVITTNKRRTLLEIKKE